MSGERVCMSPEEASALVELLDEEPSNPALAKLFREHLGKMKPSERIMRIKAKFRRRRGEDPDRFGVMLEDVIQYLNEEHARVAKERP